MAAHPEELVLPAPAPRSPVERIGATLLQDTDRVGREMVARILDEVPVYARASSTVLDDVAALAARNARVLCWALANGSMPTRADLSYVAEHVRRRVQLGVGLEPLIHAYRVGNAAFWNHCMAEAVAQGISRDACITLAKRAFDVADAVTTHAAATYVREEGRLRTSSRAAARDLLEILLSGDVAAVSEEPHVAAPGLDPHEDMIVVVCAPAEPLDRRPEASEAFIAAVTTHLAVGQARPLIATRQNELVAVIDARRAGELVEQLLAAREDLRAHDLDLRAGVSLRLAGFAGVREGYRHAAVALSHSAPADPIVALDALPAYECALLTANSTTRSIITAKAEALDSLDAVALTQLTETLTAFADANLNVTRASTALHVHANTLRYRLDRIHSLTALDPRTFSGLMELVCVLKALEHR
jgi:hypothetical protein